MDQLLHGSEYNLTNIFQASHILPTYFTSLLTSEITAKYEKIMSALHEANVQ